MRIEGPFKWKLHLPQISYKQTQYDDEATVKRKLSFQQEFEGNLKVKTNNPMLILKKHLFL